MTRCVAIASLMLVRSTALHLDERRAATVHADTSSRDANLPGTGWATLDLKPGSNAVLQNKWFLFTWWGRSIYDKRDTVLRLARDKNVPEGSMVVNYLSASAVMTDLVMDAIDGVSPGGRQKHFGNKSQLQSIRGVASTVIPSLLEVIQKGEATPQAFMMDFPPADSVKAIFSANFPDGGEKSPSDWMADLPDTTRIRDIFLPGSHETLAVIGDGVCDGGRNAPHIFAHDDSLMKQLQLGVRMVDFRFAWVKNQGHKYLAAAHGGTLMTTTAVQHFYTLISYLASHPKETIFAILKLEITPGFKNVATQCQPFWKYPRVQCCAKRDFVMHVKEAICEAQKEAGQVMDVLPKDIVITPDTALPDLRGRIVIVNAEWDSSFDEWKEMWGSGKFSCPDL